MQERARREGTSPSSSSPFLNFTLGGETIIMPAWSFPTLPVQCHEYVLLWLYIYRYLDSTIELLMRCIPNRLHILDSRLQIADCTIDLCLLCGWGCFGCAAKQSYLYNCIIILILHNRLVICQYINPTSCHLIEIIGPVTLLTGL